MTTLRQLVHGRVDRTDRRLLDREAEIRGISLTKCVGDIIREYFALRKEMVSVIKSSDALGEAHIGLVHSLVARMEGRLALSLTTRDDELKKGQQPIEAMIDWLVQLYLAHTPRGPGRASSCGRRRCPATVPELPEGCGRERGENRVPRCRGVAFARPDRQGPSAATRLAPRALDGSLTAAVGHVTGSADPFARPAGDGEVDIAFHPLHSFTKR